MLHTGPVEILVVDDEPALRTSLRRALLLDGYRVDLAEDGEQALGRVATRPPDAIVLDVLMPGIDGLEVCRRLRAGGDRTPILMLTALDGVHDRVAGLDEGADDYLVKPFALEELLAVLGEVHAVAVEQERTTQRRAQGGLVVDHQDVHGPSVQHEAERLLNGVSGDSSAAFRVTSAPVGGMGARVEDRSARPPHTSEERPP